jgi:Uncharacterised protein conserved in bacteria (DUF2336)
LLPTNFISDLEDAIARRSHETGAMLHQITDLFLVNAGHYSADQLDAYDDVLKLLISKVDVAARAALARRLAPVEHAPTDTIRSLALDAEIGVAEPILAQSNALTDDTLIDCIATGGQKHLLAIATRNSLSETVSDHLVIKGDNNVLGAVVNNPGASISELSFGILVDKGADDDWLSESIAKRKDIPEHHFRQLISKASEIVRQRLISIDPRHRDIIDGILAAPKLSVAGTSSGAAKDYRTAELVVRSQPLTEAVVNEFAATKQLEEIFVAIAQLSGLSAIEIERLFMSAWSSPVAVIMKAIGFHLPTLHAIYCARLSDGEATQIDLIKTKAEFIALRRQTAERIMRFYCTRKSTELSEHNIRFKQNN